MNTMRSMLNDYLTTRRALGFKLRSEGTGLMAFVSYMQTHGLDHITTEMALKWALLPASVQSAQHARRLGFIRGFARYCSAIDPRTQIAPVDLIPCVRLRPQPHFFSDDDIERLLQAALELPPDDGLCRWTFHCLFGLLCVAGLRIGEARTLTFGDVDLHEAILTIRSTKFGKSRLVPLHPSALEVLADYMRRRQSLAATLTTDHVFVNDQGTPLSHDRALDTFQRLLKKIGVVEQRDRRRPHLHDLRHRFALQTLLQWYRDGQDVERRLPVLSAYLGHTEVRDTYWYLSARPELMRLAQSDSSGIGGRGHDARSQLCKRAHALLHATSHRAAARQRPHRGFISRHLPSAAEVQQGPYRQGPIRPRVARHRRPIDQRLLGRFGGTSRYHAAHPQSTAHGNPITIQIRCL